MVFIFLVMKKKGISKKLLNNENYKKVYIPSKISLNLSSVVSIVLYDRNKKINNENKN